MRYVSKPTEVEAVQWTGENLNAVRVFASDRVRHHGMKWSQPLELLAGVDGAQGWVPVPIGHFIVSNVDDRSDIWPVAPDVFERKYQLVTEPG